MSFTISFTATIAAGGKGKNKTVGDPGSFGIHIDYTPGGDQPGVLPNSGPTQLKGGQIKVT